MISFDVNTQNASGLVKLDSENWTEVTAKNIMLSEGEQIVRIFVHDGEVCLNWIDVTKTNM